MNFTPEAAAAGDLREGAIIFQRKKIGDEQIKKKIEISYVFSIQNDKIIANFLSSFKTQTNLLKYSQKAPQICQINKSK